MAIGIYTDHPDLCLLAKNYLLHDQGNGALHQAAWKLYPKEHLAQGQEAGRNQGHTLMGIGLAGTLCQMVWIQGDDLFAADQNRLLAVARYGARYDSGMSVPYTPYHNSEVTQPHIAPKGRGGQYDPNSGGFDQLGYGSLLFLTAHALEK